MNTLQAAPAPLAIEREHDNLEVTALTPQEMKQSNEALIVWFDKKIELMQAEAAELHEAYIHAKQRSWATKTLKRHADLAAKRVTYYERVKAALEAGFYIVPNFPIELFAIRTDKDKPLAKTHVGYYAEGAGHFRQPPGLLPVGQGEYQSPNPLVQTQKEVDQEDEKKRMLYEEHATGWGEIVFPISMAKPKIMDATTRAMRLKIFDQIGIFQEGAGDPIIVGEILDPRSPVLWHRRRVSFIIAWNLNTQAL